jgi:outer membrane protein assembly factor BamB
VANGVVYVGSDDSNVYALNATTGAKLWSYSTGGGVYSSPAVVNGVVYVGSLNGGVYAFSLKKGGGKHGQFPNVPTEDASLSLSGSRCWPHPL